MNRILADCWLRSFPFFWQHHLEKPSWPRNEEEKLPRLLQLAQPRVSGCLCLPVPLLVPAEAASLHRCCLGGWQRRGFCPEMGIWGRH